MMIGLDYPYITTLLPNGTIEIHSVETQAIVQVIGAPAPSPSSSSSPVKTPSPRNELTHHRSSSTASSNSRAGAVDPTRRVNLLASVGGYLVPSTEGSDKMRPVSVKLLRT